MPVEARQISFLDFLLSFSIMIILYLLSTLTIYSLSGAEIAPHLFNTDSFGSLMTREYSTTDELSCQILYNIYTIIFHATFSPEERGQGNLLLPPSFIKITHLFARRASLNSFPMIYYEKANFRAKYGE